jgi:hypothetical protein
MRSSGDSRHKSQGWAFHIDGPWKDLHEASSIKVRETGRPKFPIVRIRLIWALRKFGYRACNDAERIKHMLIVLVEGVLSLVILDHWSHVPASSTIEGVLPGVTWVERDGKLLYFNIGLRERLCWVVRLNTPWESHTRCHMGLNVCSCFSLWAGKPLVHFQNCLPHLPVPSFADRCTFFALITGSSPREVQWSLGNRQRWNYWL